MNVHDFFKIHEPPIQVFRTIADLNVNSFEWIGGKDPHSEPMMQLIPAGTLVVRNCFSNFGNGHSMSLYVKRKGWSHRWFRVPYSKMEYAYEVPQNCAKEDHKRLGREKAKEGRKS
jgi:hypothetical protein